MRWLKMMPSFVFCCLLLAACSSSPDLKILDAVLSPDGKEVMFSVSDGSEPAVIAFVSTDPDDNSLRILNLPENMSWQSVAYSGNTMNIALGSWCPQDKDVCFDNATGAHVWTVRRDGSDLKRLTANRKDVGHGTPVFCTESESVLYTTGLLGDLWWNPSVIVEWDNKRGHVLTTHDPAHPLWGTTDYQFKYIELPQLARCNHFLFRATLQNGHPVFNKTGTDKTDKAWRWAILEYDQGDVRLAHRSSSNIFAANANTDLFAFGKVAREGEELEGEEVWVSSFGKDTKEFYFPGQMVGLSVNADFDRYAFIGRIPPQYAYTGPNTQANYDVWIYDRAEGTYYPLHIEERFKRLNSGK